MTHRALAGVIAALLAISPLSQVQASGSDLSTAARPAEVQVSLMSVVPGTPTGDGDFCIGTDRVMLTAVAFDPSTQIELTQGMIVFELCVSQSLGGFPKEDCARKGGAEQWRAIALWDLALDSTPTLGTQPPVPVLGWRLQFRPAKGSGYARATSAPFNLDTTCAPAP